MIDRNLLDYCDTETQRQVVRACIEHGSQRKAAQAIGRHERNVFRCLAIIRLNAAKRGYAPAFDMTHAVPPTHVAMGVSTLYGEDGQVKQQWVKSNLVEEKRCQALKELAEALKESLPTYKPSKAPKGQLKSDLHNLYTITDYHLGMLSWGEETGADWDLDIAEQTIIDWFNAAIQLAPDAESCTFAQLGDFLHWDGLEALTPASKHVLDADTRFQKVVRSAIRCMRQIIGILLAKHKRVHVIVADANHDPASAVWMREWLASVYEADKRVTIDVSPDTYYAVEFGNNLLMFHHGHKRGVKDVDSVMVAKFRESYGRTKYHYAHTGHLHHDVIRESNLMKVEQHRTLAPQDAYASRSGYVSGRDAKVVTYHVSHGEVSRLTISPEMLK